MIRRDVRRGIGTVGLVLAMAALPGAVWAQAEPGESFERFQLFTNCSPVGLSVSLLGDPDVFLRDLTDEAIGLSVRSRLRTTGLYAEDGTGPVLWIEVQVVGAAFRIDVELWKRVSDPLSGEQSLAETWRSRSTGTHGRDGRYVLSTVGNHLDDFLDDYLRVNAGACTDRGPRLR